MRRSSRRRIAVAASSRSDARQRRRAETPRQRSSLTEDAAPARPRGHPPLATARARRCSRRASSSSSGITTRPHVHGVLHQGQRPLPREARGARAAAERRLRRALPRLQQAPEHAFNTLGMRDQRRRGGARSTSRPWASTRTWAKGQGARHHRAELWDTKTRSLHQALAYRLNRAPERAGQRG